MAAEKYLWPLGELALDLFPPEVDPEDAIEGYLTAARLATAALTTARTEAIDAYVYWKTYNGLYVYALSQPVNANVPDAGNVSFTAEQLKGLASKALQWELEYNRLATLAVAAVPDFPRGAVLNKYVF